MAVSDDRVTFWFGCNMLRHVEMIRLSIMLLEKVGYDVNAVGGPAYCCGTVHDHEPRAASTMAARTVERFNEGATRDRRDKVITWCPSCHMHMSDIMAPGNATHFDIAHLSEILADRAEQLTSVMNVPVRRRVLLHRHVGFATHVAINSRIVDVLSRISGLELIEGPAHPGHMCSSLAAVPGALAAAARGTWSAAAASGRLNNLRDNDKAGPVCGRDIDSSRRLASRRARSALPQTCQCTRLLAGKCRRECSGRTGRQLGRASRLTAAR